MSIARRTEIVNFIKDNLVKINGEISTFNGSYLYNTNVFNNVYRKLKFLDEINDFPAIYLSAGTEFRNFQSQNLTIATLDVIIRAYVYGEDNSQILADEVTQDIEHVIYSLENASNIGIMDITIERISMDEGLVTPYGLAEVELLIVYRLEN